MKIFFYGSDKYSKIVLRALRQDKKIQLVQNPEKADVGVLASYGRILTKEELFMPKHGILNLHPSLLPKYRGSTPVQTAILNGEKETGLTIVKMDEEVDHGPIVAQFKEDILPADMAESLYFRLFSEGAKVLKTILPAYLKGKIKLREQEHSKATWTKKFTREDGKIDWQKPAAYIERMIRAFSPWPGTWTEVSIPDRKANPIRDRVRLKILKAHLENEKLVLDTVQLEGKKPVSFKQFLEGYPEGKDWSLTRKLVKFIIFLCPQFINVMFAKRK